MHLEAVSVVYGWIDSATKEKRDYKLIIHDLLVYEVEGKTIREPYSRRRERELKEEGIKYTIEKTEPTEEELKILQECERLRLPRDKVIERLKKVQNA